MFTRQIFKYLLHGSSHGDVLRIMDVTDEATVTGLSV